jgi:hypothetical protein
MACLFMAGWVRSWSNSDGIYFLGRGMMHTHFNLLSESGCVEIATSVQPTWGQWFSRFRLSIPSVQVGRNAGVYLNANTDIVWDWRWWGFQHGTNEREIFKFRWIIIPYWSVVIPLTILSACILLWNPRGHKLPYNPSAPSNQQPVEG